MQMKSGCLLFAIKTVEYLDIVQCLPDLLGASEIYYGGGGVLDVLSTTRRMMSKRLDVERLDVIAS